MIDEKQSFSLNYGIQEMPNKIFEGEKVRGTNHRMFLSVI